VTPLDVIVAGPTLEVRDRVATRAGRVPLVVKAIIDRVGAALALLLVAPLLLVLVMAIRATSPGSALFTQPRVGRHGRVFRIVKLRTMLHGAEAELADGALKVPGDPRITRIGRTLRRWSLDELPNLWNVLRGDMSLVGPRPDVPDSPLDASAPARLQVRPGLTGLWQVSGRSDLDLDQRARLDVHYVEHWSLALDARILGRTLAAVVRGEGAY
jgi:lipopolysaccharide/colanic/teichoic acid biosynthesis glycosyltransferase